MTLPGETLGLGGAACSAVDADGVPCGLRLALRVCHSGGGWYLGYFCPRHGPLSRESAYVDDPRKAKFVLQYALRWGELPPGLERDGAAWDAALREVLQVIDEED